MSEKLLSIKTVDLNNNCPECFSIEGLQITFKQRFKENAFYKSMTQDVITEMHCKTCDTAIYPERWTNDIERVYDYQMKAFTPKKGSIKLKGLFWAIVISIDIIIILSILYHLDLL